MYTSLLAATLTGLLSSAVPAESPTWHTDYPTARKLGREERKPLAVFIGAGKEGYHQLTKEGKLGKDAAQVLTANYVCVYVDTNQAAGKRLAAAFEVSDGEGLVLSDRTGDLQAFRHEGQLSDPDLIRNLHRFADPDRVVRTTETGSVRQASYYAPEPQAAPVRQIWQPTFQPSYSPSFGGGGGRSC